MTTLCLDFGNTRQKAAIFHHGQQTAVIQLSEGHLLQAVETILQEYQPQQSILSSVIHHPAAVETLLKEKTSFHLLSAASSRLNFTTPVGKPETIGADRLALCAAAVLQQPYCNNLIIGLGTCITYNFLNVKNEFLGGGISPGMYMRMKALNSYTAMLPIVEPDWNVPLIGYDTKTNIQSGVVRGMALEIDGFVAAYEEKYAAFNVFLTGGDAVHLLPHLKSRIFADPHFLFKGLYAICTINQLTA
jgi:type III pantothenate kinase